MSTFVAKAYAVLARPLGIEFTDPRASFALAVASNSLRALTSDIPKPYAVLANFWALSRDRAAMAVASKSSFTRVNSRLRIGEVLDVELSEVR